MLFAPGSYTGYAAEIVPGITESLADDDPAVAAQQMAAVTAALHRAAARLDDVARLASPAN